MECEGRTLEPEPKIPRASVEKIISETLEAPLTCSREVKQLLLDGCAEFVHIIATEANDVCEKEQKKTLTHEHVYRALKQLGFEEYIDRCHDSYKDHIEQAKLRPSRQNKLKDSGLTQDELEKEQEELFRKAKMYALSQEGKQDSEE
ncbi:down-regulator of transcription 1 [Nematocida minor]|uniref:down-regulator of transcription 1 n=1 Tax=Nematocida minor TaxID=1912983 RepID=UPI0022201F90|nr:down-regulator of transcription 1 [Nematocida minor]KAI5190236.1 down-regulator of transcription 1 [Nematocida minor]